METVQTATGRKINPTSYTKTGQIGRIEIVKKIKIVPPDKPKEPEAKKPDVPDPEGKGQLIDIYA